MPSWTFFFCRSLFEWKNKESEKKIHYTNKQQKFTFSFIFLVVVVVVIVAFLKSPKQQNHCHRSLTFLLSN